MIYTMHGGQGAVSLSCLIDLSEMLVDIHERIDAEE